MAPLSVASRAFGAVWLALFSLLWLPVPCLAESSFQNFLSAEGEIQRHDRSLSTVATSLEEWLAGREKSTELKKGLESARKSLIPYETLPAATSLPLLQAELGILEEIENFSQTAEPDAQGQRRLFLSLSELNEKRSLALLKWRQAQVAKFSVSGESADIRSYFEWEAGWLPIWEEEAGLTRRLQRGLLDTEVADSDKKKILKALLRLRTRTESLACPERYKKIHKMSKERLTVLARTAEQLLRIEKRKSRGALTRVRRLSRKLNGLTQDFQKQRLELLKTINE